MRIQKNPEVLQLYKVFAVLTICFICLALLLNLIGMQMMKESIAQSIAASIGAALRNHPEAEADMIAQLAEADADAAKAGQAILNKYGYHSDNLLFGTERLRRFSYRNAIISGLFAAAVCSIFMFIFVRFLKKQYARINDVTQYAKMIQEKDYALDIRDNNEGDISMLKNEIYKITTMLREQAEALKRDKRSLSNSIADISHQLKTPMTSLFVLNDLLSGDPDPETRQEFLHRIESQLNRMQWLISSLLKLSKLDAGTVDMKKETISAKELIESALEPLRIPIELKNQQVIVSRGSPISSIFNTSDCSAGLRHTHNIENDNSTEYMNSTGLADSRRDMDAAGPASSIRNTGNMEPAGSIEDEDIQFAGDFNWTREALVNILKNCVEHTPENGHIRIAFDDNPIYSSIVITDDGKGIDKEDLPYIFNRFYKGKNAGDDSIGIGLAMAKAILNAQNGDITAESQNGKGTIFTIKLYKAL